MHLRPRQSMRRRNRKVWPEAALVIGNDSTGRRGRKAENGELLDMHKKMRDTMFLANRVGKRIYSGRYRKLQWSCICTIWLKCTILENVTTYIANIVQDFIIENTRAVVQLNRLSAQHMLSELRSIGVFLKSSFCYGNYFLSIDAAVVNSSYWLYWELWASEEKR